MSRIVADAPNLCTMHLSGNVANSLCLNQPVGTGDLRSQAAAHLNAALPLWCQWPEVAPCVASEAVLRQPAGTAPQSLDCWRCAPSPWPWWPAW